MLHRSKLLHNLQSTWHWSTVTVLEGIQPWIVWHLLHYLGCLQKADDLENAQDLEHAKDSHITVHNLWPTSPDTHLQRGGEQELLNCDRFLKSSLRVHTNNSMKSHLHSRARKHNFVTKALDDKWISKLNKPGRPACRCRTMASWLHSQTRIRWQK